MDVFGGLVAMFGLSIAAVISVVAVVLALAVPALFVWMLVDSIVRSDANYPSGNVNEKILWIVLMLVFHISAIAYFFMVWVPGRRANKADTAVVPAMAASGTAF